MIITVWDSKVYKVCLHVHLDMDLCDKKILIKCIIIIVGGYSHKKCVFSVSFKDWDFRVEQQINKIHAHFW